MAYIPGEPSSIQFIDDNGDPAVGHTREFLLTGTSTPAAVAFDSAGVSTATSTTIGTEGFQENGGTPVNVYFDDAITYDIVRKDSGGVPYGPTIVGYTVPNTDNDGAQSVLVTGGSTANAIEADIAPAPGSLDDQQQVVVELTHGANTSTTPTFNLNSLGAVTIVRDTNDPLVAGDTGGSGYKLQLNYSSTLSAWVLLNPAKFPDATANNDAVTLGQANKAYADCVRTDGSSTTDAWVVDLPVAPDSLEDTQPIRVYSTVAENTTTTPTLNLNGLGAKTIIRSGNSPLLVGDLGGQTYIGLLIYSSTLDSWILQNPFQAKNENVGDDELENEKLANMSAGTVKARVPGAGSGNPQDASYFLYFGMGKSWYSKLMITNGSDSDHDIDITNGSVMNSDATFRINLLSPITKRIDANWTEGTNQGGFPSGLTLTSDTWYRIFLIAKDDGTCDAGFDTSTAATNLLSDASDYDHYRRIGWALTDSSSNIVNWVVEGGRTYKWFQRINDYSSTASSSSSNITMSVPPSQRGIFSARIQSTLASRTNFRLSNTSQGDFTASSAPTLSINSNGTNDLVNNTMVTIEVNFSSQIRRVESSTSASTDVFVETEGWIDDLENG